MRMDGEDVIAREASSKELKDWKLETRVGKGLITCPALSAPMEIDDHRE